MRVAFHPLWPEWGASSRLRVYTLHEELLKLGVKSEIAFDPGADVFVLQKHRDHSTIERAAKAKFLVYDFDDFEVSDALAAAERAARLMTTDTEGHLRWSLTHRSERIAAGQPTSTPPVAVIADPIDYGITGPIPLAEGSGICWFGHPSNFGTSITQWARMLKDAGLCFATISSSPCDGFPNVPWQIESFIRELRQFAVCVLSHTGADQGKSPNKLITAITAGVPCVVSDTPEYARVLTECGLPEFVAHDEAEMIEGVSLLTCSPALRHAYLKRAQPVIWERYNPRRIAEIWLETVRERI